MSWQFIEWERPWLVLFRAGNDSIPMFIKLMCTYTYMCVYGLSYKFLFYRINWSADYILILLDGRGGDYHPTPLPPTLWTIPITVTQMPLSTGQSSPAVTHIHTHSLTHTHTCVIIAANYAHKRGGYPLTHSNFIITSIIINSRSKNIHTYK